MQYLFLDNILNFFIDFSRAEGALRDKCECIQYEWIAGLFILNRFYFLCSQPSSFYDIFDR